MIYVLLISGMAILLVGGDLLVRGSVAVAERFHLPPLIIGLTVVAAGTSAPELLVSLEAAIAGHPGIALGNVVGSNIANVFLVLGLPTIFLPALCNQPFIRRNMMMMIGVSALFVILCLNGRLGLVDGLILLVVMSAVMIYSVRSARRGDSQENTQTTASLSKMTTGLFLFGGLVGLPLGAQLVVSGGSEIARTLGIPDAVIGLTAIAIGTSLPELSASLMAVFRNHAGVAVGNVIGSNIFNLSLVIGLTAAIHPIAVPAVFADFDLWVMLLAALSLAPFALRHAAIGRTAGAAFVAIYAGYLWLVVSGDPVGMLESVWRTVA